MILAALPKINPHAGTCVRWNPNNKRYELVVGGQVLARISRLGMKLRAERRQFNAMVQATLNVVKRKQ